jgi:hypothetical protein
MLSASQHAVIAIPPACRPDAFASETIRELRDLGRQRLLCIRMQSKIDRGFDSYLVGLLGGGGLPKGEQQKLHKRAREVRAIVAAEIIAHDEKKAPRARRAALAKVVEKWAALSARETAILTGYEHLIWRSELSRGPWDEERGDCEKRMKVLARTLPAWRWIDGIKGASDLTLAVLIAEAGDPTAYRDKHTLFKRLGIGVVDGRRQGSPGIGASAEDWIRHGFDCERRSQVYVFLDDTLFKQQWRKDGDLVGTYGIIYRDRKTLENYKNNAGLNKDEAARQLKSARKLSAKQKAVLSEGRLLPKHIDNRARRYMSQCFIRDLRNAWRAANDAMPEPAKRRSPPVTLLEAAD